MQLTVNGEPRETDAATVATFLESRGLQARLVVVEHNGKIVPRDQYARDGPCMMATSSRNRPDDGRRVMG